nr:hypothetical protein [Tanacetum cinerariifolium]
MAFTSSSSSSSDNEGNLQHALKDKGVIDSGCSRHMTGNMSYLFDFKAINGRYVAFGENPKGGKISRKGTIRTGKLDFDDVYFVKELKFNLFSVSHMCDKKNRVLFTDTKCLVLSPEFKLLDEKQVLLRVPRANNMYNVELKNIVPSKDLTCLFAKATLDESNLWHRRLDHINFKTMNKLVKGIKREFSVPRIPQQNGIAERKNRTLIEAARTMLADLLLPIPFWAEAVNTACYVQNRVLVTKPQNNTPYELLHGRTPSICFMRPFGCHVTILNTLDSLGKFDRKVDEGFLVGYFNTDGDVTFEEKDPESEVNASPSSSAQSKKHNDKTKKEAKGKSHVESFTGYRNLSVEFEDFSDNINNKVNAAELEDITYSDDEEDVGAEADFTNLETTITVSPIPTTRVHKDHPVTQIIEEPKRVHQALKDLSWIEAIQEEQLQFKMQKVWVLVDFPNGKRAIEGIDYEEVFAPVARIEAISLFLAYASFMGFMMYQMDVKSAFIYGTIEEEVYVCQPLGFEDPGHPDKVYKVVKALYGLHQAPRAWYETLANYLLENDFQRGKIDQALFIKRNKVIFYLFGSMLMTSFLVLLIKTCVKLLRS